jgi:hypothetical protein
VPRNGKAVGVSGVYPGVYPGVPGWGRGQAVSLGSLRMADLIAVSSSWL